MICMGCGVDTDAIDEYYMVQFEIWKTSVPKWAQRGILCIGCLEDRVGRELTTEDFIEAPVNYTLAKSERLLSRLGEWFRAADNPWESDEQRQAFLARFKDF